MYVPKVYHELTSTRVLTMSYEHGIPVTHINKIHEAGIDLKKLARLISNTFVRMIFVEGFVHSDPHPGNMFVRTKPNGEIELVVLDHGIYTNLTEETRLSYTKLWRGILA